MSGSKRSGFSKVRLTLMIGASPIFLMSATAHAQASNGAEDSAEQQSQSERTREEQSNAASGGDIVVTARRTRESSQRVPVAIEALTAGDLLTRRVNSRENLAQHVAGLYDNSAGAGGDGFGYYVIRGQSASFGGVPGTTTYFADVPGLAPAGGSGPLSIDGRGGSFIDLENVQVLKGPQGTLFGRNSTGGAIVFVPQRPTDRNEGYIQVGYGNYNNRSIEGAINAPIIDGILAIRVAGGAEKRNGFTLDVGPINGGRRYQDLDYVTGRVSILFTPADGFENYTIGRFYSSRESGPGWVLSGANPAAPTFAELGPQFEAQKQRGIRKVAYNLSQFANTDFWQVVNTTTVKLTDSLTFRNIASIGGYSGAYAIDIDSSTLALLDQGGRWTPYKPLSRTYSEEAQLQGNFIDGKLTFTAGYYTDKATTPRPYYTDFAFYPFVAPVFPDPAPNSIPGYTGVPGRAFSASSAPRATSQAFFGQATLDLGAFTPALDGLKLTAGRRYTREKVQSNSYAAISFLPVTLSQTEFKNKYPSFTYGVDWQVDSSTLLYVSVRDAFKTGGVNTQVADTDPLATFRPERLISYEAGVKSTIPLGGAAQLRFSFDGFLGDFRDIQVTFVNQTACFNACIANAARGRIDGLEGDAQLRVTRNLSFYGSATYLRARYTRVDAGAVSFLNGTTFPNIPKVRYNIGADYRLPFVPETSGAVTVSGSFSHQGSVSGVINSTIDLAQQYASGYGLVNLNVAWDRFLGMDAVSLSAFARNLFNKEYVKGQGDGAYGGAGFIYRQYGEPRTYGATLRYRF